MGALQRRRLTLEAEPAQQFDIHTVTQKCTTTKAVQDYFDALGNTGAIYLWIKGDNALTTNRIILMNALCLRYGNNTISVTNVATNYDATFNVGDQYLILYPHYGTEIAVPANIGVSVNYTTASATCAYASEIQDILVANRLTLAKNIGTVGNSFFIGLKNQMCGRLRGGGTGTINMNYGQWALYDYVLNAGDKLIEISYY